MTDRTDVWTYLSATSVTVPTDLTATYYSGLKTKITQTTDKYFRIESSSYNAGTGLTTINLNGFGIYTVANAPITAHSDMCAENVPGFPLAFEGSGRAGGQTITGGTASGDGFTIRSTSNGTKGDIIFGTSKYDEANNRLGIARTPATYPLEVQGDVYSTGSFRGALIGNVTGDVTGVSSENVVGPASSVDGNIALFDGVTGLLVKDGACTPSSFAASSHNHAASEVTSGTLDGDRLPAISSGKLGGVPATGAPSGKYLKDNATWDTPPSGSGDVVGPSSALDNNIVTFDNTTGKLVQDSLIPISLLSDGWIPAGETWTYASVTTFTITGDKTAKYSAGMKITLSQTTSKYFIITKVECSTDTTITVYGGTDYTLASATITDPYYSLVKSPVGFPLDPAKWTVETTSTSDISQANPNSGTWYNKGGSIAIPIGAWEVSYSLMVGVTEATATLYPEVYSTLSTANNSEVEKKYTRSIVCWYAGSGFVANASADLPSAYLNLAAATTYYLNQKVVVAGLDSFTVKGTVQTTMIRAICAYL